MSTGCTSAIRTKRQLANESGINHKPTVQAQEQRIPEKEDKSNDELARFMIVFKWCQISPYWAFKLLYQPATLPSYPMWDQCSLLPPFVSS
jgi:hypothetical protein